MSNAAGTCDLWLIDSKYPWRPGRTYSRGLDVRHAREVYAGRSNQPSRESAMGTIYRHTQVSRATVGGMGIAWAAAVWWSLRGPDPVPVTTAVLVGSVLVLFSTLTVIVRDGAMDVFFGPGLIRR